MAAAPSFTSLEEAHPEAHDDDDDHEDDEDSEGENAQDHVRHFSDTTETFPIPESLYGDALITPLESSQVLFDPNVGFPYKIAALLRAVSSVFLLVVNYILQIGLLVFFNKSENAEHPLYMQRMRSALEELHYQNELTRASKTTGQIFHKDWGHIGSEYWIYTAKNTTLDAIKKLNPAYKDAFCGESMMKCDYEKNTCYPSFERASAQDDIRQEGTQWLIFIFLILCVWVMTVWNEFREACMMVNAVFGLPTVSARNQFTRQDGAMTIKGFSVGMKAWVLFGIMIPRFVMCIFLLYVGTVWLGYTFTVADLVLNSVALAFLIDVDELLFASVLSVAKKHHVQSVEPIVMNRSKGKHWIMKFFKRLWHHIFGEVAVFFMVLTVMLAYFIHYYMVDLYELQNYTQILCPKNASLVVPVDSSAPIENPFSSDPMEMQMEEEYMLRMALVSPATEYEVYQALYDAFYRLPAIVAIDYMTTMQYHYHGGRRLMQRRGSTPEQRHIQLLQNQVRSLQMQVRQLAQGAPAAGRRLGEEILWDVHASIWLNKFDVHGWTPEIVMQKIDQAMTMSAIPIAAQLKGLDYCQGSWCSPADPVAESSELTKLAEELSHNRPDTTSPNQAPHPAAQSDLGGHIVCPGQSSYCDCAADCQDKELCGCPEAVDCCAAGAAVSVDAVRRV
jgi:hypothetical protein